MNQDSSFILIPVILSGGSGTRLWPLSREGHPKPFIKLNDGETLLEKTYRRISTLKNIPRLNDKPLVLTVTNREYYFLCKDELEKTNVESVFLLEPESRNTAPAITIAALWAQNEYGPNASMLIMPADHIIEDQKEFAGKRELIHNKIKVLDAVDALGQTNLNGKEEVQISFGVPGAFSNSRSFKFKLLQNADLDDGSKNNIGVSHYKTYNLRLIRPELINAQGNYVKKSYNSLTSDMVQDIIKNNFKSDLSVEVKDSTKGQRRFI